MTFVVRAYCSLGVQSKPVTTVMTRYTPTSASGLQDE